MASFDPTVANTLPNGAVILDRRHIGEYWVWFADFGGYQPYVTWESRADSPGDTYIGHYSTDYDVAYEDFCERIREKWLSYGHGSVS